MPANLTPQYLRAEELYRQAQTPQERVRCLEVLLQLVPRHKGTDRLQGDLRARLKEARADVQSEKLATKSGRSHRIPRQGAGTAIIIGAPNAGKSRLLHTLTGVAVEIAPYPFTTRVPQVAMMPWEDLQVQLIDTPPITRGYFESFLTSYLRSADLVLWCVSAADAAALETAQELLEEVRQRKIQFDHQSGLDPDDLSVVHVKTLGVLTHGRDPSAESVAGQLLQRFPGMGPFLLADLEFAADVERLRDAIGRSLPVIRVYPRRPGEAVADPAPISLPVGATIEELALKIHQDLAAGLKYAKVWNAGETSGRTVHHDHILQNLDQVELYQ